MKLPYLKTIFMKCLKLNCVIVRSMVLKLLYIYTITHIIYPLVELKSFYRNLEVLVKEVLLLSFHVSNRLPFH